MSKKLVDGTWVVVCDWVDEEGKPCDLGVYGEPKMFVDPDGGRTEGKHYQCGAHHGVIKQEDRAEYQMPKDHKLVEEEKESMLVQDENTVSDEDVSVKLDGFKPDVEGRVWDGTAIDAGVSKDG